MEAKEKRTRPDVAERREHKKGVHERAVKRKLNGVCRVGVLQDFIERSVCNMTQMAVEASRLCNLHVLRMIETGAPIEITCSNFFRNALCLVSEAKQVKPVNDKALQATYEQLYRPQRPDDLPVPSRYALRQAVTYQSQQMLTNAQTMVWYRLHGQLRKYLRFRLVAATLIDPKNKGAFESRFERVEVTRTVNAMMDALIVDRDFALEETSPLREAKQTIEAAANDLRTAFPALFPLKNIKR